MQNCHYKIFNVYSLQGISQVGQITFRDVPKRTRSQYVIVIQFISYRHSHIEHQQCYVFSTKLTWLSHQHAPAVRLNKIKQTNIDLNTKHWEQGREKMLRNTSQLCQKRKLRRFSVTLPPSDPSGGNWVHIVCILDIVCVLDMPHWLIGQLATYLLSPNVSVKGFRAQKRVMSSESTVAFDWIVVYSRKVEK